MAHIGVFGPFAFRRDVSLNIEDQTFRQWYQAYWFQPPPMPPGQAQPIQGHRFPTMKETYPAFNQIYWPGKFVQVALHFYKFEMLLTVAHSAYQLEGSLFVSGFGLIWHWYYVLNQGPQWQPQPYIDKFPVTDFWSADWFDAQPNVFFDSVIPRLWSDGPPPT